MAAKTQSPQDKKSSTAKAETADASAPDKSTTTTTATTAATTAEASADNKASTVAAPLGPPPKPSAAAGGDGDYFSTQHHFTTELNPFDQQFGNPSTDTPGGRPILPPVANITSPSPLPGITPGWGSSLRQGPLSPAMLTGPTNGGDYFSDGFRGFPTPNESSLRTGLTPGGGGSMFPAPSPNTQAFLQLQSGGVTPSTADFQQSAVRIAAANKFPSTSAPTSQADTATASMDRSSNYPTSQPPQRSTGQNDPFANHDVSNAANDLLSFATQNGTARNGAQPYGLSNQPQQGNNLGHMPVQPVNQNSHRRNTKGSINSIGGSVENGDFSESGQSEQAKTISRSRAKKGANNAKPAAGSKRKADETPKGSARKKSVNGIKMSPDMMMEDSDDDDTSPKPEDGRKMTDEEKRKNFLERNRVAALKCRQRKKQWLANLQTKVELFSTENDALSATVTQLREEIVNLKTLLLAHKDCPVSHAQGLNGVNMNTFLGGEPSHQNPYGLVPNGVPMGMPMQAGQMQNR